MDINHFIGGDLSPSVTGDLLAVDNDAMTQQRILRRLMTNPGSYLWHPTYGAGLGQYVGSVSSIDQIRAVIIAQMALEPGVLGVPTVTITPLQNGLFCEIGYTDAVNQTTQTLSFNVSP